MYSQCVVVGLEQVISEKAALMANNRPAESLQSLLTSASSKSQFLSAFRGLIKAFFDH